MLPVSPALKPLWSRCPPSLPLPLLEQDKQEHRKGGGRVTGKVPAKATEKEFRGELGRTWAHGNQGRSFENASSNKIDK